MAKRAKCEAACGAPFAGFWFAGWLFTVGLLKLSFWKAVLAIVIWAYYLGHALIPVVFH